MKRSLVIEPTF